MTTKPLDRLEGFLFGARGRLEQTTICSASTSKYDVATKLAIVGEGAANEHSRDSFLGPQAHKTLEQPYLLRNDQGGAGAGAISSDFKHDPTQLNASFSDTTATYVNASLIKLTLRVQGPK